MTKKYQMNLATKSMIKDQSLLRHEDIKQHIRILPELAAYIPPLSADEYRQLQENILANGCREALLIWETTGEQLPGADTSDPAYILIDGHNRYTICQQYGLDYKVHLMSFPTIEQVKFFMIDNQLGRRNLAPEQVSYLRGLRYLNEKQHKGKYNRQEQKGQNDLYGISADEPTPVTQDLTQVAKGETTAVRLGKQFNVSEKTIKRDAAFALGLERLTTTFREDILSGKQKVDKVLIQKLGQVEADVAQISSQAELEQTLRPPSTKQPVAAINTKSEKKNTAVSLKQQLARLISQLDAPPVDLATLCGEIITCARQLQLQSTKT